MNKNQVKGRKDETKGRVKEAAGKMFGDNTMEHKGKAGKHDGKAQAAFGDLKHDIKKGKRASRILIPFVAMRLSMIAWPGRTY